MRTKIIFFLLVAAVAVFAEELNNIGDELFEQLEDTKAMMTDNNNENESYDEDQIEDDAEEDEFSPETQDEEEEEEKGEAENESAAQSDMNEESDSIKSNDNEKRSFYHHQLQQKEIHVKYVLLRGWKVSFSIKPRGVLHGWSAIMHASIGDNNRNYGDRTPAVFFFDWTSKLHICSAVNGNANYCYNQKGELPRDRFSHIVIQQIQKPSAGNLYYYQIIINGKTVVDVFNRQPAIFKNVKYYQASPFYHGANAELKNFHVQTFAHQAFTVLKKNTLIKTLPKLTRGWKVSFQIKPIDVIHGWGNIMHATIHGNIKKYGDRIPGVWFSDRSTKLHICSAINGKVNYCYNQKGQLPRNKYSTIVIQQVQRHYQYYFQILINGKQVFSVVNNRTHIFNNVKYFTSDPWYNPALVIIRSFHVQTIPHRYG